VTAVILIVSYPPLRSSPWLTHTSHADPNQYIITELSQNRQRRPALQLTAVWLPAVDARTEIVSLSLVPLTVSSQ